MFQHLPDPIQSQILHLLEINDFRGAKAIYDAWIKLQHQSQQKPNCPDAIES
jgi:hypothetical protein